MSKPKKALVVNPASINLADAKAVAAQYDAEVIASAYCPPGKAFVIDLESVADALRRPM